MITEKQLSNPFAHLQGSLIRVTPRRMMQSFFISVGIKESQFTALLVETSSRSPNGGEFKSRFLYMGSLYEIYLYPSEVSAIP
jgi:hypothetical protein